jgi:hypothetical protein
MPVVEPLSRENLSFCLGALNTDQRIPCSLGLIEILDGNPEVPSLKQVAAVKGVGIGSTMIDRAFELLVQRRLDQYPDANLSDNLAHKLARSASFQSIKHSFGMRAGIQIAYKLQLYKLGLGIGQDFSYPELGIEGGKMSFLK